jgi:RNA polymerase sigma-70 factor, ECF subfamily
MIPTILDAANHDDDDAVAERLIARDPRALATVYRRHGRVVFGFLLGTLRDRGSAEDVLQQVFLEVWQRAPTFDPRRGGMLNWIMVIARSRALDHLRRRIPEPAGTLSDEAEAADLTQRVDDLAERWFIGGLLERLPREESEVIRLRFYAELSQTEIAERTGMPLGTVKTRMVSGLRRLRTLMEEA